MTISMGFSNPLLSKFVALLSFVWLAACGGVQVTSSGGEGQTIRAGETVPVALLVPSGGNESDNLVANHLEKAARMAMADLQGASIDLRVYSTQGGNPGVAANVTTQAIADGAKIIIGPLYSQAANAAGIAAAPHNVNVLSFSNTSAIAGGNVFILGPTFQNTANRLVRYSARTGANRFLVVHGQDLAGSTGRDAIVSAARTGGAQIVGIESYPMSQEGIVGAVDRIVGSARSKGANALFLTGGVNADLPILATLLPEQGLDPRMTRYVGLTRWNAVGDALRLPGLQGGYFALPDQSKTNLFENRFNAAYGASPHPVAGLAYDGIAAIGALAAQGNRNALNTRGLTQSSGFEGTQGVFRLLPNGQNERALAVATIQNNQVVVLDPAPRSFSGAGL